MLGPLDLLLFFGSLIAVMAIGLIAARRENTAEDFFLAGRSVRWWGVAGSIFGSNVSANHLVGMLGIGYSIGFAQGHFELGAIAALMLLAYGFLPVYRKLGLYTLSEYLGLRYDDRSRALYAAIVIVVVVVQLTAAFYIGSRSLGLLLSETPIAVSYTQGVVALAIITATYTIFGGLKAVVYTDVLQSVLLLIAGVVVAGLTFAQPEVGGWNGMMAHDLARPAVEQKMHLYLPPSHPDLPWTGALSGLLILHCFYWSTNQPIVQRALAARSDSEARLGIVVAGFFKLTIPFFAIAGGVAAAQLFDARLPGHGIDPDAAMPELIKLVVPMGYGLMGIIMAGLIGAILSSIDSMVNSASTLVTFDLYKKYLRPDADDSSLLPLGRWVIAGLISGSAALALLTYDPTGGGNFFLRVSSQAAHFTPGLVVAFALGMFWRGANRHGALAGILLCPVFSFGLVALYDQLALQSPGLVQLLGDRLNFLHRVFLTLCLCALTNWIVSRATSGRPGDDGTGATKYTFVTLHGSEPRALTAVLLRIVLLAVGLLGLGGVVAAEVVNPQLAAGIGAVATAMIFVPALRAGQVTWWRNDLAWSAALCAATVALMFWYF